MTDSLPQLFEVFDTAQHQVIDVGLFDAMNTLGRELRLKQDKRVLVRRITQRSQTAGIYNQPEPNDQPKPQVPPLSLTVWAIETGCEQWILAHPDGGIEPKVEAKALELISQGKLRGPMPKGWQTRKTLKAWSVAWFIVNQSFQQPASFGRAKGSEVSCS